MPLLQTGLGNTCSLGVSTRRKQCQRVSGGQDSLLRDLKFMTFRSSRSIAGRETQYNLENPLSAWLYSHPFCVKGTSCNNSSDRHRAYHQIGLRRLVRTAMPLSTLCLNTAGLQRRSVLIKSSTMSERGAPPCRSTSCAQPVQATRN